MTEDELRKKAADQAREIYQLLKRCEFLKKENRRLRAREENFLSHYNALADAYDEFVKENNISALDALFPQRRKI
jgi:ElaB/YqjD/DUF883 family membrane-anchored ribosome-binding protein